MRKNRIFSGVVMMLLVLSLASCEEKKERETEEKGAEAQHGMVTRSGSDLISTPDGYYGMKGDFLYYITPDLEKSTVVCSKPDCTHDTVKKDSQEEYAGCDAHFQGQQKCLGYYKDKLYIVGDEPNTTEAKTVIYQVSMDGSERSIFYEAGQKFISGFYIYEKNMYLAENAYTETSPKTTVKEIAMEDPEQERTIFESTEYGTNNIGELKCYGKYCQFGIGGKEGRDYISIDLETGETSEMQESGLMLLDRNDYGTVMEIQDFEDFHNGIWKSRYYKIPSGETKRTELTEEDFGAIADGDTLGGIDETYIYFSSISYGANMPPKEEQKIRVYDYKGKQQAEIPFGEQISQELFMSIRILPGDDKYMFVQTDKMEEIEFGQYEYYYVDKTEFDGGTAVLHKLSWDKE